MKKQRIENLIKNTKIDSYAINGKKVSEKRFFAQVAKEIHKKNNPPKFKPHPTIESEQPKLHRYLKKMAETIGWKDVYFSILKFQQKNYPESGYTFKKHNP